MAQSKYSITILFLGTLTLHPVHSIPDEKITNNNIENTEIEQQVYCYCEKSYNNQVVECVFSLPVADQRKALAKFSPEKRKEYIRRLTFEEYAKFLKAYSEPEWQKLYASLTPAEKKCWPKSVKQQWIAIENIKDYANCMRNVGLGLSLFAYSLYPPSILFEVAQIAYMYKYNIHPVVEEEIKIQFKEHKKNNFDISD